jgi:hypothetical protein
MNFLKKDKTILSLTTKRKKKKTYKTRSNFTLSQMIALQVLLGT